VLVVAMFQIATSSALDGDVGFERAPAGGDPVVLGCQVVPWVWEIDMAAVSRAPCR
jgi:hypothetical protein